MDKIKVAVLNPTAISEAEKMMVCAARLTQRGHTVKDLSDFLALYDKEYTEKTAKVMTQLPHPTIQKFAVINAVIVESVKEIPRPDYETPERGQVHVCVIAVQRLLGRGRLRCPL